MLAVKASQVTALLSAVQWYTCTLCHCSVLFCVFIYLNELFLYVQILTLLCTLSLDDNDYFVVGDACECIWFWKNINNVSLGDSWSAKNSIIVMLFIANNCMKTCNQNTRWFCT